MLQRADEAVSMALPGEASSVGDARAFVQSTLEQWGLTGLCDTVILLTSELATNAVVHAQTSYDVLVERNEDVLRVSVLDDSPLPPERRSDGLAAANGRGVALVDTLAPAWGPLPAPLLGRAKGIWFELPTDGTLQGSTEGSLYGSTWADELGTL